jgi:HAD domain in Swiss Army Knife RNA repair proteins
VPERAAAYEKPLLMVDIDGVISLFGVPQPAAGVSDPRAAPPEGTLRSIDGAFHFLSSTAAAHLLELGELYELVWASGWEERANEHLPHLLGLPRGLPFLRFERSVGRANAHWKLDAIDAHAGARALAWIDDALVPACHDWAQARAAPTLLVQTDPRRGLTSIEAARLADWARALAGYSSPSVSSSGSSSSASSSAKPGSVPPAPIFSSEARSASNSCP